MARHTGRQRYKTPEQWEVEFRARHGNTYEYDWSNFVGGWRAKVQVYCQIHDHWFPQSVNVDAWDARLPKALFGQTGHRFVIESGQSDLFPTAAVTKSHAPPYRLGDPSCKRRHVETGRCHHWEFMLGRYRHSIISDAAGSPASPGLRNRSAWA